MFVSGAGRNEKRAHADQAFETDLSAGDEKFLAEPRVHIETFHFALDTYLHGHHGSEPASEEQAGCCARLTAVEVEPKITGRCDHMS